MTEVAVAAAAFDTELGKALGALPPYPATEQHDQVLAHQRAATKIQELCDFYARKKLPPFAFAPRLVAAGAQLFAKGEYNLAVASCYARLIQLNLPQVPEVSKLDTVGKLGIHVQALYGLHSCQAAQALRRDPHITHITTLQIVLQALAGIKQGCSQAVLQQQLYWLVYNGTVHLHRAASALVTMGYYAEALPYYVYAAKVLESHVSLSSPQFLPWRLQMYSAAAHCYSAIHAASTVADAGQTTQAAATTIMPGSKAGAGTKAGSTSSTISDVSSSQNAQAYTALARKFLQNGLAEIQRIQARTSLDPVPPPPALTDALQGAQSQLTVLKALFDSQPPSGSTADSTTSSSSLQAVLAGVKPDSLKLQVLLGLLLSGVGSSRQPLQQIVLPPQLQPVLEAAIELINPALNSAAADGGHQEQRVPQWETLTEQLHLSFLCISYRYSQQELSQRLLASVKVRIPAAESDSSSSPSSCTCLAATAAVLEAVHHLQQDAGEPEMRHMAACLKQHSRVVGHCLPGLLAAAAVKLHVAAGKVLRGCLSTADGQEELTQLILEGLHEALQQSDCDDGVLRGCIAIRLAVMLQQLQELEQAVTVIQQGISAITAARCDALWQLHGSPDEHLRWISGSCTQADDATAALLAGMSSMEQELACLHADAMLVLQRLQLAAGLKDAVATAAAKRDHMLVSTIKRDKQSDIYGPRTMKEKRLDEMAIKAAGHAPNRNELCERELLQQCGKNPYQRALLLSQIAAVQPSIERQAAILEEACDLLLIVQANEAELFASQQPSAISPATGNPHAKLLQPKVLCRTPNSVTVTHFPLSMKGSRQPASFAVYCKPTGAGVALSINKTAMEYPGSGVKVPLGGRVTIEGLQSNETYIFAMAVYDDTGELIGELGHGTPSIVMALPLPLYTCWAHVLLTAAQLQHWTTAKRAAGVLFPRFIATAASRAVWQANPMDRHQLQLQHVQAAAGPLLRLLVQAMYVYAFRMGQQSDGGLLAAAALDSLGGAESTRGLAGTSASRQLLLQLSDSKLPRQVLLLEWSKKLLAAMQVAAIIGDEMLIEEGALRAYDLLAPLLQQQDISPLMHQALSTIHLALTAVKDSAPTLLHGHSVQRIMAARATAAVSYWLMRLSAPTSPALAAGAAAGAIGGITARLPQPAAAFAQLDAALMKCLTWQCHSIDAAYEGGTTAGPGDKATTTAVPSTVRGKAGKAGGKQGKSDPDATAETSATEAVAGARQALSRVEVAALAEHQVEVIAAQDYVMLHPDCAAWASAAVSTRLQNTSDLVAQVLSKLSKPDPLSACWPLLSPDSARAHPRWLQLCVLVMQAAAKQHGYALLLAMPPAQGPGQTGPGIGLGLGSSMGTAANIQVVHSPSIQTAAAAAAELIAAVQQHVLLAARRPQFLGWQREPKWTVDAAAAALQMQGFALGDQGTAAEPLAPQPDAGASAEVQAAAKAEWEQQKAELLAKETRRLAAALLLQQRLPVLLQRRHLILHTRQQLAAWAPWLAHLHTLLGGLAAEAASNIAATMPISEALGCSAGGAAGADGTMLEATRQEGEDAPGAVSQSQDGSRPATARSSSDTGGSPGKKTTPRTSRSPTPRGKEGKVQAAADVPTSNKDMMKQLSVQALQQLSQAATLAARAGPTAWQELFSSTKQLWNVCRFLVNRLPALTAPMPAVAWVQGLLPGPKAPPLLAEAADRSTLSADSKDADSAAAGVKGRAGAADKKKAGDKGGKGTAADKKAAAAAASGAGGKGGGKAGAPLMSEVVVKQLVLPEARGPNVASMLRAVAEAVIAALDKLRAGAAFYPGVIPVQLAADADCTSRPGSSHTAGTLIAAAVTGPLGSRSTPAALACAPATARSSTSAAAASDFSLGSDAAHASWHAGSAIDVASLTQLLTVVLKVLQRMERWHSVMSLGRQWLDLCDGSADAVLLPMLLFTAPKAGASEAEIAALTSAHQACLRDKNAAFDALEKVRQLTAEQLSDMPLLSQLCTSRHKHTVRRSGMATSKSGNARSLQPSATLGRERSGMTVGTSASTSRGGRGVAGTLRTAAASADHVMLPAEYEKVVEQLRKRGEKGHMVLAQNELGDVFAHFGMWAEASSAWGTALDTLLGPYQVVANWTRKLELGCGWQQLLRCYGVHGLLQAGVLLGKLARYIYYGDLGSRLSCARLAAELLPAVFASNIIHPQRAVDCAVYVPVEIWPGIDIFDDPYRCNASDLLSALETLSSILTDHQLCLPALPLLALWEHIALHITHNTSSLVLSRVVRVKALAQLGYLAEAGVVLQGLLQGTNLPGRLLPGPQPVLGPDGLGASQQTENSGSSSSKAAAANKGDVVDPQLAGAPILHASKWPGHPSNAALQACIADAVLAPCLAAVYGPWLCGQVALARASWLAAAGGVVNCWKSSSGPSAQLLAGTAPAAAAAAQSTTPATNNSNSSSKGGGGTAGTAAAGATAAGADSVESKLLDKAAQIIQATVSASRKALGMAALSGCTWDQDDAGAAARNGAARGGSSSGGKDSPGKAVKAGAAKAAAKAQGGKGGKGADKLRHFVAGSAGPAGGAAGVESGDGPSAADQLRYAQHQQLMVAGLQQLAEVELLRWMPSQALQSSLAAAAVLSTASGTVNGSGSGLQLCTGTPAWQAAGGSNDDLERVALQPSMWISGRLLLARVLLQLRHYAACVSVTNKALEDARAVGDSLWAVQLQQVQANASAALGDAAAALMLMRDAFSRLHTLALPGHHLLSLQLDSALLHEQLGARGEVDRLANQALANSSSLVEQQGLQEMLENPELLNIYLPAVTVHLETLLLVATTNTRRRQLATAERLLRQASMLLAYCRCLPGVSAQVALQLAQVLRLQAALRLPATDLVLAKSTAAVQPAPTVDQTTAPPPLAAAAARSETALRGIELQMQRLNEASELVTQALQLLVREAGSPAAFVRKALLELAAVWLYQHQLHNSTAAAVGDRGGGASPAAAAAAAAAMVNPGKIASLLQAAHNTAAQLRTLNLTNYQLQPVNVSSLPGWLLQQLKAQEQLQISLQLQSSHAAAAAAGKATGAQKQRHQQQQLLLTVTAPTAAAAAEAVVPDTMLGRLAICHYVRQLSAANEGLSGLQQRQLATAQAVLMQAALKMACPKFAAECCWPDVPAAVMATADVASVPVGAVNVQWYCQDCCWQEPSSWRSDGILPSSSSSGGSTVAITRDALRSLPQIPAYASCIYAIHVPGAAGTATAAPTSGAAGGTAQQQQQQPMQPKLICGEVVVSVDRLRRIQLQVKLLRQRLETPAHATDLFALPPPSGRELAAAKHSLEGLLSGTVEEDMGQPPADLPAAAPAPPAAAASASNAAASAAPGKASAAAPAPATAAKPGVAAAKSASTAAASGATGTAAAVAAGNASGDALVLDWRDVSTWVKAEALLNVEDGLQGSEGAMAAWLGQLLGQVPTSR